MRKSLRKDNLWADIPNSIERKKLMKEIYQLTEEFEKKYPQFFSKGFICRNTFISGGKKK